MDMVEVRDAERADRPAIRDIHVASVRGLGPDAYDDAVVDAWTGDESRDPRQYRVEGDDVVFLVAVDDGQRRSRDDRTTADDGEGVVGFGELTTNENATREYDVDADAEIRAMYVAPDRAGEGVGAALLGELEARARTRGVSTVALTASLNAVGFYEHHGYERVNETAHASSGSVTAPVVVMRKRC